MAIKIVYHDPCFDGFTAAWAAYKALGKSAEYIPAAHGSKMPDFEPGDHVYWVDFTYPAVCRKYLKEGVKLQIIDHHKTGIQGWGDYPGALFDMNHSGAYLSWEFFHEGSNPPALVKYVEDRDLWRWKMPNSREVTDWLGLFPLTFDAWDEAHEVLTQNFDQAVSHGQIAAQAHKRAVEDILTQNVRCCEHIGGYSVPVANCPKRFGSDVAIALLAMYPDAPFAAYYSDVSTGVREYGLRSRSTFDVTDVAKKYGGGGHPTASGFRVGRAQSLELKDFQGIVLG